MALPQAVQQAERDIAKIEAQMAQDANTKAPEAPVVQPQADNVPPAEPLPIPEKDPYGVRDLARSPESPDIPAPEPPAAPIDSMAPLPTPTNEAEYQRIAKAHEVLQGKYSAEVPRMAQETRDLREQLGALKAQLEQLQTNPPTPATPAAAQTNFDLQALKSEYPEELVAPLEYLINQNTALQQQVQTVTGNMDSITQSSKRTAEQQFYEYLSAQAPDWKQVDADPQWRQWLTTINPLSGQTFEAHIIDAKQRGDAQQVVAIIAEWKRQTAQPAPVTPAPPVAPHATNVSPNVVPQSKKYWTKLEANQFMTDLATGRLAGMYSPEQLRQLEADFDAAPFEGRMEE